MKRARSAQPKAPPSDLAPSPSCDPATAPPGKSILYFSTNPERLESLIGELEALPGCSVTRSRDGLHVAQNGSSLCFLILRSPVRAMAELHRHYFNLVILDLRLSPGLKPSQAAFERGLEFLDEMDQEPDVELRYSFRRILALVSGSDSRRIDERIRMLGSRGVGSVLREPFLCELGPGGEPRNFAQDLIGQVKARIAPHRPGKMALCAAGGGTTGIYFETGVIKCLSDCLPPWTIHSFDMMFGISAGAVVTGVLANGYTIEEFMAAVDGVSGGRIPPMSLSLLQLPHLNLSSLLGPIKSLAQRLRDTIVPNSDPNAMESIFDGYSDILNAPFQARGFERVLNTLFSKPGTTNNFRRLKTRLYIGATDQDARTHVLFGDPPHDEIPISRAIEASISINPVFRSTEINGRFYCDGAVTRTSGFSEAVKKGATLVLAIDPFVPYVSKRPGYAHHKGALYHVDQDIRTVTFTRYETTRHWLLRHCPDVSLYTFLPANRLRKVMSVNPMDHRPYLAIWRGAYLSTLQRILAVKHRLTGDLATRGIALNTDRAEDVAKRLEATRKLTFQDFFPDGQPSLRPSGRLIVKLPARQFPLLQPSLA